MSDTLKQAKCGCLYAGGVQFCAMHAAAERLLKVSEEIANDSRIDLVDSERRIRLYSVIHDAGGNLCGHPVK